MGDRYGRCQMLLIGVVIASGLRGGAWAPSIQVLILARLVGGLAAGMAYPTTLSLITALWTGAGPGSRSHCRSALGGAISALGPLVAGCC
ncbi:MAG: hypothetical protein IPF88_14370 [Candidatus Microthrix sp.]|nr:hypothetical protein [Candidatus Microthrix sp.]